jgi:hypothetical protein
MGDSCYAYRYNANPRLEVPGRLPRLIAGSTARRTGAGTTVINPCSVFWDCAEAPINVVYNAVGLAGVGQVPPLLRSPQESAFSAGEVVQKSLVALSAQTSLSCEGYRCRSIRTV